MTPNKMPLEGSLSLGTESLVTEKPHQPNEVLLHAAQISDNATMLQKELISSQVLTASQDCIIFHLKLQVQMKDEELMLQKEKQVRFSSATIIILSESVVALCPSYTSGAASLAHN